jgi:hypothetical protein
MTNRPNRTATTVRSGAVRGLALLLVGLSAGACSDDLTIPNFNNPAREDLTGSPTRQTVAAATQGIISGHRGLKAGQVGRLGVWGREYYDLRPEEPRPYTDALIDPIDPVNGGLYFGGQYTQIAHINTVISAAEAAGGLSDAERRAVEGFAKTFKADAFWQILMARPEGVGIPLDPNPDPNGELTPVSSADQVYTYILDLYDEALADLNAGGGAFPFSVPDGLAAFNTPATFAQVNRALKVRALKYLDRWGEVASTLPTTFVDPDGDLDAGAYFDYSTISGDATNGLFGDVNRYAHPRVRGDAQLQPGGEIDQRARDKTLSIPTTTIFDITVTERMDVYKSLTAPLPWITNDELVLTRAEARLANGDRAGAIEDVNRVRTAAGGLEALEASYGGDLLDEILYNRFMSLIFEGGFHYYDMRQYDKLDELPRALPSHKVYPGFPYPTNECLARELGSSDPACATYTGS